MLLLNVLGGKHQSSGVSVCMDYSLLLKQGKDRASWTQKDKLHPPPGYPSSPYLQNLVSDQLARETCPAVLGGQSGWTDRQWPPPTTYTRDQTGKATPFFGTAQPLGVFLLSLCYSAPAWGHLRLGDERLSNLSLLPQI